MKKRTYIPKAVLKSLAFDIKALIHDNEGKLIILEVVEEIPYEIREHILTELAGLYDEDLAIFFKLLWEEYETELETVCRRAFTKYRMAGIDIDAVSFVKGDFYKAYASLSRQSGRISLEVAWHTEGKTLELECFYLAYDTEGIHSFFLINDVPIKRYEADRREILDMVELDFEETCILLKLAFEVNKHNMTRPAVGKFLYKKYLDFPLRYDEDKVALLTRKLSAWLMPRQLVNSLFYALKQKDNIYVKSVLNQDEISLENLKDLFSPALMPGNLLLEARADEVVLLHSSARASAHMCIMNKEGIYNYAYEFTLEEDEELKWKISSIQLVHKTKMSSYSDLDPHKKGFFCLVYEIIDINELFVWLEEIRLLKVVGEIPHGIHLRISSVENEGEWDYGIAFLGMGEVDVVINGDELVIICRDYDFLSDLDDEINIKLSDALEFRGEYEVDLAAAYNYIQGEYASFEDVVRSEAEGEILYDGMCFLSARYLVRNRDKVRRFLNSISDYFYNLEEDYYIFYQLEKEGDEKRFLAEYALDEECLTVSAYGEDDLSRLRQSIADKLCESLEFMGIETRREGLFAILDSEVKRAYPDLEKVLKELYLNKWVKSSLYTLKGMTPSEASQSAEGQLLLWDMFKKMKKNENRNDFKKKACAVKFKDYISKLEPKWKID